MCFVNIALTLLISTSKIFFSPWKKHQSHFIQKFRIYTHRNYLASNVKIIFKLKIPSRDCRRFLDIEEMTNEIKLCTNLHETI